MPTAQNRQYNNVEYFGVACSSVPKYSIIVFSIVIYFKQEGELSAVLSLTYLILSSLQHGGRLKPSVDSVFIKVTKYIMAKSTCLHS